MRVHEEQIHNQPSRWHLYQCEGEHKCIMIISKTIVSVQKAFSSCKWSNSAQAKFTEAINDIRNTAHSTNVAELFFFCNKHQLHKPHIIIKASLTFMAIVSI